MQKICDEAISLLRAQKRAYYIVELFNIYLCIADKLCETLKDDGHVGFQKQVKFDKRRIRQWLDAILNEYRIREVPLKCRMISTFIRKERLIVLMML